MTTTPMLLEINARCWLQELGAARGQPVTLGSVPVCVFEEWVDQGVTHLWLMGVWTTGPLSRARAFAHRSLLREYDRALPGWRTDDVAGSPYAIERYAVPDALGGENGLREFGRRLHDHGIKLVLDFVPNHVGLDHRWIRDHPDYCVQSRAEHPFAFHSTSRTGDRCWIAHGKDPHFPPWDDTVQLDYRRADVHRAMQEELLRVAALCDGVRCDMAMLSLNDVFEKTWADFPPIDPQAARPKTDFWHDAIRSVKAAHPDFMFLAEVYWGMEERLQELGFDYTYDKELTDALLHDLAGRVVQHVQGNKLEFIRRSAHFLENHDEARVASVLSLEEHRAAALTCLALPGMRFLHEGQTDGATVWSPVQLARRRSEPVNHRVREMYQALFEALRVARVGQGGGELLRAQPAWPDNPTHQDVLAIRWSGSGSAFGLAVVNPAAHPSQCHLPLTSLPTANEEWCLADQLGDEAWIRTTSQLKRPGLFLDLAPHAAQVFLFEPHQALESA